MKACKRLEKNMHEQIKVKNYMNKYSNDWITKLTNERIDISVFS